MINKFLGLRTCIYRVPDLAEAVKWYEKAFSTAPYFNEPFYAGFNISGYELGLQPAESGEKTGDTVLIYWGVNDIVAAVEMLASLGATKHEEPQNVGGDIIVASVKDPWGNIIGLIRNPGFSLADPPVH